jgi:Pirin
MLDHFHIAKGAVRYLSFCLDQIPTYVQGFPDHPHRGQATVTYITQGASKHEDSAGHAGIIREGGVQWMCAVCAFVSAGCCNRLILFLRAAEVSTKRNVAIAELAQYPISSYPR